MRGNLPTASISRRAMLRSASCGFGYMAFAGLASDAAKAATASTSESPLAAKMPHFRPRAKRVIFMFMDGGPSHMDTFDYKPQLAKDHGKKGKRRSTLYGSPFKFARRGESGLWISELFPEIASRHIDDLCVVRSMHTDIASHPQAVPFFHTGNFQFTRPSMGAWVLYGLGTENQNLPGFITINPPPILGGAQNYGSAFLPACYQGTRIGYLGQSLKGATIKDLASPHLTRPEQREQVDLIQTMNRSLLADRGYDPQVEGVIGSMELGSRMQDSVPEVMDLSRESEATLKLYGIGEKDTDNFGRQCLLARRFAESGVRFIEIAHTNWDQHRQLTDTLRLNGRQTDLPIAGLLTDLAQRGLLEDTLVLWSGEFGRLPEIENGDGRSHNADAFTLWMAGGGVRGGMAYGETDEHGYASVQNRVHLHDLHATMLHLLGFDHTRLTFNYSGRDHRLTDLYGNVIHELIA